MPAAPAANNGSGSGVLNTIAIAAGIYGVTFWSLGGFRSAPPVEVLSMGVVDEILSTHTLLHVGGPHRGGTTLVARLLAADPHVLIVVLQYFFRRPTQTVAFHENVSEHEQADSEHLPSFLDLGGCGGGSTVARDRGIPFGLRDVSEFVTPSGPFNLLGP